jgi:hypothetical protein
MARKPKLHQQTNEERVTKLTLSKSKSNSISSSKSQSKTQSAPSKRGGNKGGKIVNGQTVVVKYEYSIAGRMNKGVRHSATDIGASSGRLLNYMNHHGSEDLEKKDEKENIKNLTNIYNEDGSRMTEDEHKKLIKEFNSEKGVKANGAVIIDNGSSMTREEMSRQVRDVMQKFKEETGKDFEYKYAIHTDKIEQGGNIHAHILLTSDNGKDVQMTKEQLGKFKDITANSAQEIMNERSFLEKIHHARIDKQLEKIRDEKREEKVDKTEEQEIKNMLQGLKGEKVEAKESSKEKDKSDKHEQQVVKVERKVSEGFDTQMIGEKIGNTISARNDAKKNNNDELYRQKQHEFFNLQAVRDGGFDKSRLQDFVDIESKNKNNPMTKKAGDQYVKNMEYHVKQLESAGILEKSKDMKDYYYFVDDKAREILYNNAEKSFKDIAKINIHEYKKAVEEQQNSKNNSHSNKDNSLNSEKQTVIPNSKEQKIKHDTITIRTDEKTQDEVKKEKETSKPSIEEKEVFREKITRHSQIDFSKESTMNQVDSNLNNVSKDRDALSHLAPDSKEYRAKQEQFFNLQMVKRDGYSKENAEKFAKYSVKKNYMNQKDANQFLKNSEAQAEKMERAGILEKGTDKNGNEVYKFVDDKAREVLYKNSEKDEKDIAKANIEEFKKAEKMQHEFKDAESKSQEQNLDKNLTLEQQMDKAIDGKLDNKANALQH